MERFLSAIRNRGKYVKYIRDQALHHQKAGFKAEFCEFLLRHEMDFDERYVWDEDMRETGRNPVGVRGASPLNPG